MGRFLNPDNGAFQTTLKSEIYVDKSELIAYTNKVIGTEQAFICNSRPRRFGKSITANMLSAYYSKGCDSEEMFKSLKISQMGSFKQYLNQYDVIHFDVQWCMMDAGSVDDTVDYINEGILEELTKKYKDIIPASAKTAYGAMSYINAATGNKFIVIIDEWDILIRDEANNQKVQEKYINFLRGMFKGVEPAKYIALAYLTGILPIKKLKTAILAMLSGDEVRIKTTTFQNDMVTFRNKDDVLTLLVHLGYLAFNQKKQVAYIPNEEIRREFMDAVEDDKWSELIQFERESEQLLDATLDLDSEMVAKHIDRIHMEYTSVIQYNNENSLSSVLAIAYLSAMNYYFKPIRELPTGRGFADFVFVPKPEYRGDYPALVVELKWNKNVHTAIQQIRDKNYPQSLLAYTGNILLVGISYDKESKVHECRIEEYKI